MAQRQIPPERRRIYYIGRGVTIVGFLSFLSVFITVILHFGDVANFVEEARSAGLRAIIGMGMMIAGLCRGMAMTEVEPEGYQFGDAA